MKYADVIVNISLDKLDRSYQYRIPKHLEKKVVIGANVMVSFGNGKRMLTGYVVGFSEKTDYDPQRIKPILSVVENALAIESKLIQLAYWMKENYGGTINEALKTVIPIKRKIREKEKRLLLLLLGEKEAKELLEQYKKKKYTARERLLSELIEQKEIDYEIALHKLNIGSAVIKSMEKQEILKIETTRLYRNPIKKERSAGNRLILTKAQEQIAEDFIREYRKGNRTTCLIHGITGSGKTELYMAMMEEVLEGGKQVIFLIPEIALTYQMVKRFQNRFGDRITILNSRMSAGERYDQYIRAKQGEIDIVIGPRSALFTPFEKLGMIILDEEHESSYKSETVPKYHTRETAIARALLSEACVILGSATPSLESYYKALSGEYRLYNLEERAGGGKLPKIHVVDLREELRQKNRSIFSRKLKELMEQRLERNEQIMLFINRRGYAGFVSCRSCGYVMKCPHCDVSLTSHRNGMLICHYCGYQIVQPERCPSCDSRYIAAFGTGTQKVEEMVRKEFTNASVLRMDTDTTEGKEGHEKILAAFACGEADILVGTQMIVKGHDFGNVTLVGVIAADLSLYANDYRASERTFDLLAQAAGRAGRSHLPGEVVIQTYNPDHYSIRAVAQNNYRGFYEEEMMYRRLMQYPPISHVLAILVTSRKEQEAEDKIGLLKQAVEDFRQNVLIIGPAKATLSKLNDIYRRVMYLKAEQYETLKTVKNQLEQFKDKNVVFQSCGVQFDFDPINSY